MHTTLTWLSGFLCGLALFAGLTDPNPCWLMPGSILGRMLC
jgi:hypothetical protein